MKRKSINLTLILLTVFLSACSGYSGAAPVPINTVEPAAQPTAAPTDTPIPPPTPTAPPVPIEVVHEGERSLRNGDWDSAAIAFQTVLTDPGASTDERIRAQIGLAHSSLKRGDFGAAQAVLDSFLAEQPDHTERVRAFFLRGEAKAGLGDWQGAIDDYTAYLTLHPGLIDSIIYERIGDGHLALGSIEEATTAYENAIATETNVTANIALREKAATIYRSLGNPGAAVTHYEAIVEQSTSNTRRATAAYSIAQTWFEAAEYETAYAQLEHVFMTYPQQYEALTALRELLDAGYEVDQYQRGLVNYYQGQYDIAIGAFLNYIAELSGNPPPDVHLLIGRAYRYQGNLDSALSTLEGLVARYNPDQGSAWGDAWLEIGGIYSAQGNIDSAFETYDTFIEDNGSLPQVPDVLFAAGQLAQSIGDTARATGYYQRLGADYPDDARGATGLHDLGMTLYRNGDFATAVAVFTNASQYASNPNPANSLYWLGRSYQQANQPNEATTAFSNAQMVEPFTYYGLRAEDQLTGRAAFGAPATLSIPVNADEGRQEAEEWIVGQFGLSDTPPLAGGLREDIASDQRFIRAQELWNLGLVVEAKRDYELVRKDYWNDPLASYQLAIYFREIGLYRSSILSVKQIHELAGIDPLDGPVFLARLRYPTYFSDLVLAYSEQYGLDPLYVFALIEQESLFEGFAMSTAAAQGLMQIWPPTGEDIAARIGWPDYRASDLQRPYVNVAFGTWLLSDEFVRFEGDPFAVLAAYNAGSGNALNWKDAAPNDPDLYVESITMAEPEAYIKGIYAHYAAFRALYGTP
ncbi:MAG: tetratricopeptide repeat protein [Anaerolineae bacterium]|nr:tetratricopeptide repeat protein [Anaerolineae bacterium]